MRVPGTIQNKNKCCQSLQIACNDVGQVFVRIANEKGTMRIKGHSFFIHAKY